LHESTPKTRAGHRVVWLDDDTIALLRKHREVQELERQFAGEAWQDHGLIFCQGDGSPWRPDVVTRRFQAIARAAGLPVIKLHEGRHSAVSLQHGANVNPELTQRTVGHATRDMTRHYPHRGAGLPGSGQRNRCPGGRGPVMHRCSTRVPFAGASHGLPRPPAGTAGHIFPGQRRRTGIEPAGDAKRRPPVLKTGGATRHPDASGADVTRARPTPAIRTAGVPALSMGEDPVPQVTELAKEACRTGWI
jgi:Phage integrase family